MPNSTASEGRSSENVMPRLKKRRGFAAPVGFLCRALLGAMGLVERDDRVAALELRWVQDHLLAGLAELVDVLVRNVAEPDHRHCRLGALAVRAPADRPDDGLDLVLVQVV